MKTLRRAIASLAAASLLISVAGPQFTSALAQVAMGKKAARGAAPIVSLQAPPTHSSLPLLSSIVSPSVLHPLRSSSRAEPYRSLAAGSALFLNRGPRIARGLRQATWAFMRRAAQDRPVRPRKSAAGSLHSLAEVLPLRDRSAWETAGYQPAIALRRFYDGGGLGQALNIHDPASRWEGPAGEPVSAPAREAARPAGAAYPIEAFQPLRPMAVVPPQASAPRAAAAGEASGANRSAIFFVLGLVIAQIGLEAWGSAWAQWVKSNYGMAQYSTLTMVSMFTSLAAGYVGGLAVDKLGLKRTYVGATILGALGAAATLALFKFQMLPFAVLVGLGAVRTFLGGVSRTAEQTIPVAIYKDNPGALEKFNSTSQFILEIAGIGVPFLIGALLSALGFLGTMSLLPATALAAAMVFILWMKVPEYKRALSMDAERKPDPALLKIGSLGYPAFTLLNILLYGILAFGFGMYVFPGTGEAALAAAAAVQGKIVSLYSLGGLIAALILSGWLGALWKRIKGLRGAKLEEPAPDPRRPLRSVLLWTRLGALGLAGFIPFLWTNPTLASLAMIPFGVTNVMAQIKYVSLVQANVPQEKRGKVMGTIRTSATVAATVGTFGFGWLFEHYPASPFPFWILLGVLGLIGAYYLWVAGKLSRYLATRPPPQ